MLTKRTVAAVCATLFLGVFAPCGARAQAAEVDNLSVSRQSAIGFTVYTKMLFTMKQEGRFREFEGGVAYDPALPTATRMHLTVYTSSIDTKDTEHDAMLRSSDFFDTDRFPTMRFVSTGAALGSDGNLIVTGDLTIRGITKQMAVPVDVRPPSRDGDASPRLETTFEIDRTEFGLNGLPKWGGVTVSVAKNVKIHLAIATTAMGVR